MAVGFFTQGITFTLPHPKIPQRTILLLCKAIEKAWQLLEQSPPKNFVMETADEDSITRVLVDILEGRLRQTGEVDGFDLIRFGRVIRAPKIANVDNKHPDKMPDIFFDLKRDDYAVLSVQDGLFVECKPVDGKHPITSCYCKKGLMRFVNGDYAWAMQDALMVGYVKDGFSFDGLVSVLDSPEDMGALNTCGHSHTCKQAVYSSDHKREFAWPENCGQACGISVVHLWLPFSAAD